MRQVPGGWYRLVMLVRGDDMQSEGANGHAKGPDHAMIPTLLNNQSYIPEDILLYDSRNTYDAEKRFRNIRSSVFCNKRNYRSL